MKTSTEWLFEKLWDEPKDKLTWYAILQQAKEMEKMQIMDAMKEGYWYYNYSYLVNPETEEYYTETLKNK